MPCLNTFSPVSATDTYRFYSVWHQTILLVNGEPLRVKGLKCNSFFFKWGRDNTGPEGVWYGIRSCSPSRPLLFPVPMTCSFCYYQGFVCLYHLLFTNHRLCLERQGASHGFFGFKGHAQLLFTQSMWNISLTLSMAELQQTKTVAFHPIKAQKKT